jgi:subtilisin family serine protease
MRTRRLLAVLSSAGLLAGALLAAGPVTAAAPNLVASGGISRTSTYSGFKSVTGRLAKSDPSVLKSTATKTVPVMVKLDFDALASYLGDIPGLAATSPQVTGHPLNPKSAASTKYLGYVSGIESKFASALKSAVPSAVTGATYEGVYGGVAVRLPANKASKLLALPGVAAVQADTLEHPDATPVADDDASFIGANAAYNTLGSSATAGKGVIIADVDTGVWPEHPSFAARGDLNAPPPTTDNHARACNFGDNPLTTASDPFTCNDKLIEGQVFLDTYNSLFTDELYPDSARDSNGHGTHTTSTSGGNPIADPMLFGIDRGPIQGIAPGAYLMSYKALGPKGGFDSDLVGAIEQAVYDGANVINYSIGPSTPQSAYTSPDDLAFLDAFDAGVVVSTSAGNSGPNTAAHLGPWEMSAGASTLQRAFTSTATLNATGGDTLNITGSSIMPGISAPASVVEASDAPYADANCGTLAPAHAFDGEIVICVRGGSHTDGTPIGRAEKGFNVLHGGAVGMFLINPVVEDTETDDHWLPAVHFDAPAGGELQTFMSGHTGVTATFTTGQKSVGQGDVMAAFSSTGPSIGDFLKPDIAAPGVQILAGNTPTPTDVASGPPGQYYQAIAGTSMAAPHITGSAALVLALHPGLSPAEVKSALMMTANRNVVEADGSTPATPFDDGAGRVDLNGVVSPGLVLDVTQAQMDAVLTDPLHRIDLNEPSVYDPSLPGTVTTTRTFTSTDTKSATYSVSAASTLAGGVEVSPSSFTVKPGQTVTLTVTLNGANGTVGTWYFGQIDLAQTNGSHHLHLPVAFKPSDVSVAPPVTVGSSCTPSTIALDATTSCTSHVVNNAFVDATVSATMSSSNNLKVISGGQIHGRTSSFGPTTLAAATPPKPHADVVPGGSPLGGYFDISGFGSISPIGDEQIVNYNVPPFLYDGVSYTQLGVVSDGYLVVGGGDANDVLFESPGIPNSARPNNVLAPFWADLDGGAGAIAGQGYYINVLCADASHCWIIVQYQVHPFGRLSTQLETFQVWIGINGTQDISYTFGSISDPITSTSAVGAEDVTGLFGNQLAGLPSDDVVVSSSAAIPGGSADFSAAFRGTATGTGTVETDLVSNLSRDTSVSRATVHVTP